MKLKLKFSLLMLAIFVVFAAASWFYSRMLLTQVNEQWGMRFAEKQVLFDKQRTLLPLTREIALSRQVAAEPAVIEMATHEDDLAVRQRAIEVLERYRSVGFQDHNYFIALAKSGNYYFNDAANQFAGKQRRYTLSTEHPADKWFYATLASKLDYQVNIDPDVHLNVTKVWINVLIKRGDEVLGVIGTGMDITQFIKEFLATEQEGVRTLFVDRDMAIQLYQDQKFIDFSSITKSVDQRRKVDVLLKDKADIEALREVMKRLQTSDEKAATLWVTFEGKKYLLGVSYLPEIDWFDLTLMDARELRLLHDLTAIPLLLAAMFLVALIALWVMLQRLVLRPVAQLQSYVDDEHTHFKFEPSAAGSGELAQLTQRFRKMGEFVRNASHDLESKIKQRTEELHRLVEIDPLTELLNRRGMLDRLEADLARQRRQGGSLGLLLLDMDHFKEVNDKHGHALGDQALSKVAHVIQASKRTYDHAARWGGEEFLIVLPDCGKPVLLQIAERIRTGVESLDLRSGEGKVPLTVSIGVYHAQTIEDREDLLQKADKALYMAKDAGRNCIRSIN